MKTLIAVACAAAIGGALMSTPADAAMMSSATAKAAPATDSIVQASFWARPYPYGYAGWRRCRHGVRVETPNGWRCDSVGYAPKGVILNSRG